MNIFNEFTAAAVLLTAMTTFTASAQSRVSPADVNRVTRLASAGDADALNQLGVWHYSGQNVHKDIDKAFGLWQASARQGNPKAIANLGICYQYGTGARRDSLTAMRLYVAAIDAGQESLLRQRMANVGKNAFDGMLTGLCYEKGIGVPANLSEAARAYRASADLGSADGAVAAARSLLALGDAVGAYRYALRAVEAGNPDGQALAGTMLVDGKGVTPSTKKGVDWLLKAAPYNTDATNRLTRLMLAGAPEVKAHTQRVTSLMTEAARRGNRQAMLNYAAALRDGTGVNRDYDRAMHWLSLVGDTGDEAEVTRFVAMSPESFRNYSRACALISDRRFDEADRILKNLARGKFTEAAVLRAAILADPANPDADADEAVKQLRKLSAKSSMAATRLAEIYRTGPHRDTPAMLSLLEQAARRDYGPAEAMLADIYRSGDGVPPDPRLAASYASRAYAERDITSRQMAAYSSKSNY